MRRLGLGMFCLLWALGSAQAVEAQSALDPTLVQAFNDLAAGDYSGAASLARADIQANSHHYNADFVVAVGDCVDYYNGQTGRAELLSLIDNYALPSSSRSQVDYWLARCMPPPPPPPPPSASSGDIGMAGSALTGRPPPPKPSPASATAVPAQEPGALLRMGALVANTSFSGDDYADQRLPSAAACAQACRWQAPCRSMTYIVSAQICYLKRSVPPAQHGADFISAAKIEP